MPSVLIIAEYGTLNGGERSLLAIVPELARANWALSAVVPGLNDVPETFANSLAKSDVQIVPFQFTVSGKRKPLDQLRTELSGLIQESNPDVVHCNSLSVSRICGPVTQSLGIPSTGYLRDIVKLGKQWVRDLNCLDQIVAVSQATKNWHVGQGIDERRLVVIHNGVDPKLFFPRTTETLSDNTPVPLRRLLGIPGDCPLVLFVGQIGLRKGVDTWLQAASLIRKSVVDVQFLIVGQRHSEKPESIQHENDLHLLSEVPSLLGTVHWLGTRSDVPEIMRQSNLLLHCARQEPLGRVLLEACASGLPIVATDVGGTREILNHPKLSAFCVPVDDAVATAIAAVDLLQDQAVHAETGRILRKIALESFSIAECSTRLMAVYQNVRHNPERKQPV